MRAIFGAVAVAVALAPQPSRAVELFIEEFDQPVLSSAWKVTPLAEVRLSLSQEPGHLCVDNHGTHKGVASPEAARLSRPAPTGGFSLETELLSLRWSSTSTLYTGPGLYVSFQGRGPLVWLWCEDDKEKPLVRVDGRDGSFTKAPSSALPQRARIGREGTHYTFESWSQGQEAWVVELRQEVAEVPLEVGLVFPKTNLSNPESTGSYYAASLGYFRLEGPEPEGPPPALAALSSAGAPPGATLIARGTGFRPGYSYVALNQQRVSSIVTTAEQAVFQVPVAFRPGPYSVVVMNGPRASNPVPLEVLSGDCAFNALPTGGLLGDTDGDGKLTIKDVISLLRVLVGL